MLNLEELEAGTVVLAPFYFGKTQELFGLRKAIVTYVEMSECIEVYWLDEEVIKFLLHSNNIQKSWCIDNRQNALERVEIANGRSFAPDANEEAIKILGTMIKREISGTKKGLYDSFYDEPEEIPEEEDEGHVVAAPPLALRRPPRPPRALGAAPPDIPEPDWGYDNPDVDVPPPAVQPAAYANQPNLAQLAQNYAGALYNAAHAAPQPIRGDAGIEIGNHLNRLPR